MDERLKKIKKELEEMEQGKLEKYDMKPVDYQIILVIARYLTEDGKALTFHKKMADFFKKHGFTVTQYIDGINWLITA